jgi:hypothetical protein
MNKSNALREHELREPNPGSKDQALRDFAKQLGCSVMLRAELFFGLSRKDGTIVTEMEWDAFVVRELITRFPAGMTIMTGDGHYASTLCSIEEKSRIVTILHPDGNDFITGVREVRNAYERLFKQECVLIGFMPVFVPVQTRV